MTMAGEAEIPYRGGKDLRVALGKPFPAYDLNWVVTGKTRKGDTMVAPYINARAVQVRLDEVVGPENWQTSFSVGPQGGVLCTLSIRDSEGVWIAKQDVSENTDYEGIKGGVSGALRRAAVQWGIGRYLYYFGQYHLPGDHKFLSQEQTNQMFNGLPAWAKPGGSGTPTKVESRTHFIRDQEDGRGRDEPTNYREGREAPQAPEPPREPRGSYPGPASKPNPRANPIPERDSRPLNERLETNTAASTPSSQYGWYPEFAAKAREEGIKINILRDAFDLAADAPLSKILFAANTWLTDHKGKTPTDLIMEIVDRYSPEVTH